ncbi:nucleic acid-binding protein [Rutstroemia sp. NJR-2017a BBW]|nr:nucleic acid-binding protein [Rutstroemia sp. NJR-2017a BBW]
MDTNTTHPTPGDGFIKSEVQQDVAEWDSRNWHPPVDAEGRERVYEEVKSIADLVPGLRGVRFMGRVRALNVGWGRSTREKGARGWVAVVLGDEGGCAGVSLASTNHLESANQLVLSNKKQANLQTRKSTSQTHNYTDMYNLTNTSSPQIKLYFAQTPYPIQLGSLLSIWTAFISASPKSESGSTISTGSSSAVSVYANMFPGRNRSDCVMIMAENEGSRGVCRVPMGAVGSGGKELNGLMTLESWKNGGWDGVPGARILVCVGGIDAAKTVKRKDKEGKEIGSVSVREVELVDHTGSVVWSIWGEDLNSSLESWEGKGTVLLITEPVFKVGLRGKTGLVLGRNTWVDVEPECADARWLRRWWRGRERRRARVGLRIPEGVFEKEGWDGPRPALFKLADVDEWARDGPYQTFTGFISVIILDVYLVQNYRRNMLMYTECCNHPHYTNSPSSPHLSCPHCHLPLSFTLNPHILGTLLDETGSISAKDLIWAPRAWEDLIGRKMEEVCLLGMEGCTELEERLRGMRGSFWVGWVGEGELDGDGAEGDEGKDGDGDRDVEEEMQVGGKLCVLGMKM